MPGGWGIAHAASSATSETAARLLGRVMMGCPSE